MMIQDVLLNVFERLMFFNSVIGYEVEYSHVRENEAVLNEALFITCSSKAEWSLVGRITSELHANNLIWYCNPNVKNSSTARTTINNLRDKGVLFKLQPNYYMVNPVHICRGNPLYAFYSTLYLCNSIGENLEYSQVDLLPIKEEEAITRKELLFSLLKEVIFEIPASIEFHQNSVPSYGHIH